MFVKQMYFYRLLNPWDHFSPVRIENSSKLPQDLRQIVEYFAGNGSHTFDKNHIQHFCQKLNFYRCVMGNRPGQNNRNDRM